MPTKSDHHDLTYDELQKILDQEISQLPEKYALPLILCYLEGKTNTQAAAQLGWPEKWSLAPLIAGPRPAEIPTVKAQAWRSPLPSSPQSSPARRLRPSPAAYSPRQRAPQPWRRKASPSTNSSRRPRRRSFMRSSLACRRRAGSRFLPLPSSLRCSSC